MKLTLSKLLKRGILVGGCVLCAYYLILISLDFHYFHKFTKRKVLGLGDLSWSMPVRTNAVGNGIGTTKGQSLRFQLNPSPFPRLSAHCEITVVLILCRDGHGRASSAPNTTTTTTSNDFGRQINQTLVLLKSILITSKYEPGFRSCVKVILVSDDREHFEVIKARIFGEENWDSGFTEYLRLAYVPVKYPPGTRWMRKLFRPCATLRLFLPDLLPDLTSVIYLDTDIIFLESLSKLWAEFNNFRSVTLSALAPCLFHYGTPRNLVPYYGESGLNAGLMLMNLSRMRESRWTNKIRNLVPIFRSQIKLADQDILNIYFHYFPDELSLLPCDWNWRPFQCREGSSCTGPRMTEGVSALHGNALSFTATGPEPLFQTVFHLFQTIQLHSNFSLQTFIQDLDSALLRTEQAFPTSDCAKYGGFNVMVLNRLERILTNDNDNEL